MPFKPTAEQIAIIKRMADDGNPWRVIAAHPDINTTVRKIRHWAWAGNFRHPGARETKKAKGWREGTPDKRADFGYVERRGYTHDDRFAAAMAGQSFDSQRMKPIGRMRAGKPETHISTGSISSDLAAIGGTG